MDGLALGIAFWSHLCATAADRGIDLQDTRSDQLTSCSQGRAQRSRGLSWSRRRFSATSAGANLGPKPLRGSSKKYPPGVRAKPCTGSSTAWRHDPMLLCCGEALIDMIPAPTESGPEGLCAARRRGGLQHRDRARAARRTDRNADRAFHRSVRPAADGIASREPCRYLAARYLRSPQHARVRAAHGRPCLLHVLRRELGRTDARPGRHARAARRGQHALLRRHQSGLRARCRDLRRTAEARGRGPRRHARSEYPPELHPGHQALSRSSWTG